MTNGRFERVIRGTIEPDRFFRIFDIVIRDIDIHPSRNRFTLGWEEEGVFAPSYYEQDFDLTGASISPIRGLGSLTGSRSDSVRYSSRQTLVWTVQELRDNGRSVDFEVRAELPFDQALSDLNAGRYVYNGEAFEETLDGTSRSETVFLGAGNDTYFSADRNNPLFGGGNDVVYGGSGNDTIHMRNRPRDLEARYAGFVDGGAGVDNVILDDDRSDYRIIRHGDTLVFRHQGYDADPGLGRVSLEARNIETFNGVPLSRQNVEDYFDFRAIAPTAGPPRDLSAIRDFDGNDLGQAAAWKHIGSADAQFDGDVEHVYVNPRIGRWATVGPDAGGDIDFGNHGRGGDTRVVGIYIDPLVESGEVERFSDFDSQRRFQNDLFIDNLELRAAFDFDADGFQEMYFRVTDGTAYLRALMHADGNIQYANYQNDDQVRDYLTELGYGTDVIDTIIG